MPEVTVYCNGATITGQFKDLKVGRPMLGPVRCDAQVVRLLLTISGPDTEERIAELQAAVGIQAGTPNKTLLLLIDNLLDAEIRRLGPDAVAYEHGCEDAIDNARRREEYLQARRMIRELLDDAA